MSYNGWSNRETWLVNLHFNPETIEDLELIKIEIEEEYENLSLFIKDFLDLDKIDWEELKATIEEKC